MQKIKFKPQPFFNWPDHTYLKRLDQFVACWSLFNMQKKKKKKKKKSISHHNLFSRQESGESWNLIGENYFLVCPGTYSHICLKKFNQYVTLKDVYVEATNQLHSSIDLEILRLLKISKNAAIWLPKSTLSDKSQTRYFPEMQYSHNHKEDYGSSL